MPRNAVPDSGLKTPGLKMSRSAPTSPRNLRDLNKSSALPSSAAALESSGSQPSPRKSRNATLANFLKKLSPKLRQSCGTKSRGDKTWYVVDINDPIDGDNNVSKDDDSRNIVASTSGFDLPPSRRPPQLPPLLPASPKHDGVKPDESSTGLGLMSNRQNKLESESDQKRSNEELLGTQQQQSQPLIRINDTDCSPTQKAGTRVKRTQQPPKTLNILNKIVVHQPSSTDQKATIRGKMASIDSIGSCSLDIDATASESSGTADGRTSSISQRTLHSVSVEFSSLSTQQSKMGQRSLRSPTTAAAGGGVGSSDGCETRYVTELYITNGGGPHDEDADVDDGAGPRRGRSVVTYDLQPQRKPSYIGISCSVSGYTSYSCYGSKTSRDNSPARLAFACNTNNASAATGTTNGDVEFQGDEKYEDTLEEDLNTFTLNVNNGMPDVVDCSSSSSGSHNARNGVGRRSVYRDRFSSYSDDGLLDMVAVKRFGPPMEMFDGNNNGNNVEAHDDDEDDDEGHHMLDASKSLIQQRIERLYGPAALAQGFLLHRTHQQTTKTQNGSTSSSSTSSSTFMASSSIPNPFTEKIRSSTSTESHLNTSRSLRNTPAVFRHLRKNFTDQLTATTTNVISPLKNFPPSHKSPTCTSFEVKPTLQHEQQQVERTPNVDQKISPISNGNHASGTIPFTIGDHEELQSNERMSEEKDAHWFILTMNDERDKIKVLITRAEGYLVSGSLPEDACGRLRAAIGKATLLLAQKFQQFRGLCDKNIIQGANEPFPTTVSDLAGFWDMVLIQVDDIHKMFGAIEKMRDRGWIVDEKEGTVSRNGTTSHSNLCGVKSKRGMSNCSVNAPGLNTATNAVVKPQQRSAKADEAARARTEARKRLLEAKRKGRQASANDSNATASANIEIYVPEKKE